MHDGLQAEVLLLQNDRMMVSTGMMSFQQSCGTPTA
jgi:hypothetical protein